MESPDEARASWLDGGQDTAVVTVLASLLFILLTTRLLTGTIGKSDAGPKAPSMPAYWFPLLGHTPQLSLNRDSFLSSLMKRYAEGISSLNLRGSIHTFVAQTSLIKHLMDLPESVASSQWTHTRLLYTNFGFRKGDDESLVKKVDELSREFAPAQTLNKMLDTTVKTLNRNIADFVTFNSQPADQMEWEQVAEADVVEDSEGEKVVEADLMELTRAFVARVATPSVFGTDFCDNFPDFAQYIWLLDRHFNLLASGLPGWVPYRSLQIARSARRKLLTYLEEFHTELEKVANDEDPEPKWENLEDVSPFIKARQELFRKEGASIRVRAALDLRVLYSMNADSAPLVSWMIYEINRDAVLLEQIREEIAPFMDVVQPRNDFGLAVWMAPEMRNVDVDGLMEKCPLLKASYIETVRLYTAPDDVKHMEKDTVLRSSGPDGGYKLKQGTYVHASYELHHLDPRAYPDPHEWQPARHIIESSDEKARTTQTQTADFGTIHPLGRDTYRSSTSDAVARELLVFTAAILSLYDFQPASGRQWGNQKVVKTTSTKHPARRVMAWIRRREVRQEP